jgi:hypothetical protein
MKRITLTLGLPLAALLVSVAAPRSASAHERRGHDRTGHGNHAAHAPRQPQRAHWRAPVVTRAPAPIATPVRLAPPRPVYVGPNRVVAPAAGHWGWHGQRRVWFGVATVQPYAGWSWTPAHWVWDGYQWIWEEGYWAPPA